MDFMFKFNRSLNRAGVTVRDLTESRKAEARFGFTHGGEKLHLTLEVEQRLELPEDGRLHFEMSDVRKSVKIGVFATEARNSGVVCTPESFAEKYPEFDLAAVERLAEIGSRCAYDRTRLKEATKQRLAAEASYARNLAGNRRQAEFFESFAAAFA